MKDKDEPVLTMSLAEFIGWMATAVATGAMLFQFMSSRRRRKKA